MSTIIRFWPILVALVAISVAWGETRWRVSENSEAVTEVQQQAVQSARIEEQLKAVQDEQAQAERRGERQEVLLIEILQRLPPR